MYTFIVIIIIIILHLFEVFMSVQCCVCFISAPRLVLPVNPNSNIPNFITNINTNNANANANLNVNANTSNGNQRAHPCIIREQDQYMPIANVIRIMRRILPPHAKISDDAKETIQECVSEYISFITGEANERCQREQRKTVTAEDVLWAMGKLGFDDYVEPLTVYLNRYREAENERNNLRVDQLPYVGFKRSMDYGPVGVPPGPPPYGPGFPMAHHPGLFDASAMGGGYHNGSGAGGSSSSSGAQNTDLPSFDPYAQFKWIGSNSNVGVAILNKNLIFIYCYS